MKKIITICVLALLIVPVLTVTATENEVLESQIQTISAVRRPTPKTLNGEDDIMESEIQTISAVRKLTAQSIDSDDEDKVPIPVDTGQAPNTPIVSGPESGVIGERYEYTITSLDPQGDDVYYKIFWGDCAVMYWDGPHKSGEKVTYEHAWCEVCCPGGGDFTIQVWVKDVNDNMGDCKTFEISMGQEKHESSISSPILQFLERLMERFPLLENLLDF